MTCLRSCGLSNAHGIYHRADDKKDIILSRLNVYREETMPLIEYYSKEDVLKVLRLREA